MKPGIKASLTLLLILAGGIMAVGYYFVFHPNTTVQDEGYIYIRPGDTFSTVTQELQKKGYLKNRYTFQKVAALKKYPALVKSGRYKITDGMSNNELVGLLRSGRQSPVHFTFNNIRTLEQFAGIVSRYLDMDSLEFITLLHEPANLQKWGVTEETLIGLFIPNTYQIYWDISPEDFVERMRAEYQKFWNDSRKKKAEQTGLTPMDVMTLASIVEEETNRKEEYPIIAGVYMNRLKKGWKLEACPTLKFALGDFTIKRILDKHQQTDSPYNTYKNAGLPPGPVRMPSVQVIEAVLNYQHHDYMFFCAKSDFSGRHYFSRTLREHNKHAAEYHRALNQRKIYQ